MSEGLRFRTEESAEQARLIFARQVEDFRRRWHPEGEDFREFETELYYLLQKTQDMAREPLLRHMSAALALAPNPFFVVKDAIK